MDKAFWIGLGIAIASPALQYAVKNMPPYLSWGGVALGLAILAWGVIPDAYRPHGQTFILVTIAIVSVAMAVSGELTNAFDAAKADLGTAADKPIPKSAGSHTASPPSTAAETITITKPHVPVSTAERVDNAQEGMTGRATSPEKQYIAARVVVENPVFGPNPGNDGSKTIYLPIRNRGPGFAYAGVSEFAYVVTDQEMSKADVDAKLRERVDRAAQEHLPRDLSIEDGQTASSKISITMDKAEWDDIVKGKRHLLYWAAYAYLDGRKPSKAMVSYIFGRGDGSGDGVSVDLNISKSGTEALKDAKRLK